ncbi:MAG: hypothetical protein AB7K09_02370, partial [Planctomycetota bacterium]
PGKGTGCVVALEIVGVHTFKPTGCRPWVTVKHQRRIDHSSEHTTTPRNARNARHHHKARSEGLRNCTVTHGQQPVGLNE